MRWRWFDKLRSVTPEAFRVDVVVNLGTMRRLRIESFVREIMRATTMRRNLP
jgi:hypothetical protein